VGLRACIHRGAQEVGGSCVELEHDGQRIVLDVGLPLDVAPGEPVSLPEVSGFDEHDPSLIGVVVSHGHPDHYGLLASVSQQVPVYIGEATERILREAAFFTPTGIDIKATGHLRDRKSLELGPFTVTPYLMDHSAFDAYALLVEAGGQRLFYTGDLRAHGRKASLFERLVRDPPADVDTLLLEGTHVTVDGAERPAVSERDVEASCVELFRRTTGMALACYSPQNVDRLVTLYRAAKRSGRLFVMDLYAAAIAKATGNERIPQAGWDRVRVYVPNSQRIKVKRSGQFERVNQLRHKRLFADDLAAQAGELVMTFRGSMAPELERASCLGGAEAVWSMWAGYLEQPSGERLRQWLNDHAILLTVLHASGHASVSDLQRLASALQPERLVPIHTWAPQRYAGLFDNVKPHLDGEWWAV
jgi:ribonuclease J